MEIAFQLMMGISLAACAGLRAWLPLLAVGLAARFNVLPLNPSYAFLVHDGVLITFAVASVIELLGDKFIAIDHALDVLGTFVRPIAGAVIAGSLLVTTDPATTLMLGLIVGGGASLTIHAGKAATRAKVSALSPGHLGFGNAMMSIVEDIVSAIGIVMAIVLPILAFCFAVLMAAASVVLVIFAYKAGRKIFSRFGESQRPADAPKGV